MDGDGLEGLSPVRFLEKALNGGPGPGNIGVVAARPGVGKTAVLVGIGLDSLLRGRRVLHVSLDRPVEKTRLRYDDLFSEWVRSREPEDSGTVRLEVERNRRIHSYLDNTFSVDRLAEALKFMRELCDFRPAIVVLDGYGFEGADREELVRFRTLAENAGAEFWMSAAVSREPRRNEQGIPEPLAAVDSALDVILEMAHDGEEVRVRLLKDRDRECGDDLGISFDPGSRLLVRD